MLNNIFHSVAPSRGSVNFIWAQLYTVVDIFLSPVSTALLFSVMATLLALLLFGYVKGRFTGARPLRSALQTALIGGLAAAAAFLIARLISRQSLSIPLSNDQKGDAAGE